MKKPILSLGLVIIFTLYTVYQRAQEPQLVVANAKQQDAAPSSAALAPPDAGQQSQTKQSDPIPAPASAISKPKPIPAPAPMPAPAPAPVIVQKPKGMYNDGQYTGDSADAYYGNVQVQVTIRGGKIADVRFLDYPQDRRTSLMINSQAMPYLKQEAIQAQSANVDIVSGATATSEAFQQSLASALAQAKS